MITRMIRIFATLAILVAPGVSALAGDDPENLKVLPKNMGRQEVIGVMKQWTEALGVRCDFCHVQKVPGDFNSFEWASDAKEYKLVARRMLQMVIDLNGSTLPSATGEADAAVSCVTCHRGLTNPATIDRVMLKSVEADGGIEAVARYRNLRERYYGTHSYDFSPRSLLPVIEELSGRENGLGDALLFAELVVEMNPEDADSRVVLAQLLINKGDQAGAAAALDRALELEPQHRHAKRLRGQLKR